MANVLRADAERAKRKLVNAQRNANANLRREVKLALLNARNYVVGALRGTGKGAQMVGESASPRQQFSVLLAKGLHRKQYPRRHLMGKFADKRFFFVRPFNGGLGGQMCALPSIQNLLLKFVKGGYVDESQTHLAFASKAARAIPPQLTDKGYRHQLHQHGYPRGAVPMPKPASPRPIFRVLQPQIAAKFARDIKSLKDKIAKGTI